VSISLKKSLLLFALFVITFFAVAQKKPTIIKMLNADKLSYVDSEIKARKLIGNVRFKHEGAIMTCDSAYLFTTGNTLKAYSNVTVNQGDSIFMYGDSLYYNGNTKLAELRGDILLKNSTQELETKYLDYDAAQKTAYYYGNGIITNKKDSSIIKSKTGTYFTKQELFIFSKDVEVTHPDYYITSDSLGFNQESNTTYFYSESTITSDSNTIFCNRGSYNQESGEGIFANGAEIQTKEQIISGDSIFYNQKTSIGELFENVDILDTVNDIQILGNYAKINQEDSTSLVIGEIEMIQMFSRDSLFLHTDTLYSQYDSSRQHRQIFAYHKVQFYKSDLQGRCDSMVFNGADSTTTMFTRPIIWSKENQMTADTVVLFNQGGQIDSMLLYQNAFVVSQEQDTSKYNQIRGKLLTAFFDERNEIKKINIRGNGQTTYYGQEEDGSYLGMNRLDCSSMNIALDSNKIQDITFYVQPKGTFYPVKDITEDLLLLKGFIWLPYLRPNSRMDIFEWMEE